MRPAALQISRPHRGDDFLKADGVADSLPNCAAGLLCHPRCHRHHRHAPRLRACHHAAPCNAHDCVPRSSYVSHALHPHRLPCMTVTMAPTQVHSKEPW